MYLNKIYSNFQYIFQQNFYIHNEYKNQKNLKNKKEREEEIHYYYNYLKNLNSIF